MTYGIGSLMLLRWRCGCAAWIVCLILRSAGLQQDASLSAVMTVVEEDERRVQMTYVSTTRSLLLLRRTSGLLLRRWITGLTSSANRRTGSSKFTGELLGIIVLVMPDDCGSSCIVCKSNAGQRSGVLEDSLPCSW